MSESLKDRELRTEFLACSGGQAQCFGQLGMAVVESCEFALDALALSNSG